MNDFNQFYGRAYGFVSLYAPKIILAIIVLVVGLWIIRKVVKMSGKGMDRKGMDASLKSFLSSLISIGLKVLLLISVAGMVGIQTTSFIAVIGAAGLAIGFGLQGTLANFAGGVLILLFKPFKVGDFIEAQGHLGVVKEIQLFVTILLNPQNKTVFIPNGVLSNGNIVNFTLQDLLRVDMMFGISYNSDIAKAKEVLMNLLVNHPKVLKEPAPFVGVAELADSSVNLAVRPYTKSGDYWEVHFFMHEQGKIELEKAGITIPFPQVDVHMQK